MATNIQQIMERIWARRVPFFLMFFGVVFLTYAFLVLIDFVPEPVSDLNEQDKIEETEVINEVIVIKENENIEPVVVNPLPTKIIFDTLDKEIDILNPISHEIEDLDEALLSGVVRHPDSADFSETGNIFILGHSSYLPNVFNRNFQAFNGIQKLSFGDTIRLQSEDMEYMYSVEKVFQATASDVTVPMTPGRASLTLATCNSFGSKDDRFIVEAKLVSSYKI